MALDSPRAFLVDLDGVLYIQEKLIPGAIEAIRYLETRGIPHRFVTNTTSRSRRQLLERLRTFGFVVSIEKLFSAPVAAARYLRSLPQCRCFYYANKNVLEDFEGIETSSNKPTHIVIGDVGNEFSYAMMNRVFRLIMDGAEILALQKNRYWLTGEGLTLDAGAFVAGLEFASGKTATVFGKPSPQFFLQACASLGLPPSDVGMIGDDLRVDIEGAQEIGMQTVFVQSGKDRETPLDSVKRTPDLVLATIGELPSVLGPA